MNSATSRIRYGTAASSPERSDRNFGSHSVYHVLLPSGARAMANFVNQQRWASERFTWNDEVWLSWGDTAGVVLTA